MCGRVVQKTPLGEIRVLFETVNPVPNAAPTYNGAPTDTLPVVRLDRDGRRSLDLLRWGLAPYWAKDIKKPWPGTGRKPKLECNEPSAPPFSGRLA
jgi:putative SOS response-associated peptidase YedK